MTALELARFALYADLGVVFGLPAAAVLTRVPRGLSIVRPLLLMSALFGLPLSILGYLLTVAEMAGIGLREFDWQLASDLAIGSAFGWAFLVRMVALAAVTVFGANPVYSMGWGMVPAAVAISTLAWSGHAASGEGSFALVRLGIDIVHLLAASIWIGALVLYLTMLWERTVELGDCARALARFGGIGSYVVATLAITGISNLLFLAPPRTWPVVAALDYGHLLGAKIAIVVAMLGFAGLNRFVLVPRIAASASFQDSGGAIRGLKLSIAAEFCAALAILLVVSRLGLLDPAVG